MSKVQHGGPSTKEGEGVLAGHEEGSDELNKILRRTRGPGLCSPDDFKYERQRLEEEEERNMAPRRGRILREVHHRGPHAGEEKENCQRTETSGENEQRRRPQRICRLRASRPPKDSSPTPSPPSPTTPDYTQYPSTSTPRPGILHAKGSACPQQPIVCPL